MTQLKLVSHPHDDNVIMSSFLNHPDEIANLDFPQHAVALQRICRISFMSQIILVVLTSSYDSNYVPNGHEDIDKYGSFALPSEIIPYQSYPESIVNQNEIPDDLSC